MRNVLALISLFLTNSLFAQHLELKVYQNSDFYQVNHYNSTSRSYVWSDHSSFTRISVAVALQTKKKFFHELELFIPRIHDGTSNLGMPMNYQLNDVGPNVIRKSDAYAFRYQMTRVWQLKKNMVFTLGAAINPYYLKTKYAPLVTNSYPRTLTVSGASLNFVPGIRYTLSSKFLAELNMPFKIYDYAYNEQRIENPSIPIRQQTAGGWTGTFFETAYNIRLGIAYKL